MARGGIVEFNSSWLYKFFYLEEIQNLQSSNLGMLLGLAPPSLLRGLIRSFIQCITPLFRFLSLYTTSYHLTP